MSAVLCTITLAIRIPNESSESGSSQPTSGVLYSFTISSAATIYTMILTLIRLDESGIEMKAQTWVVIAVALIVLVVALLLAIKIREIRKSWKQRLSLIGIILMCSLFGYWAVYSTLVNNLG